jgi:phosphatidylethanolamine/phosphatidyl-N-methylethanolamine N-methyltransferase
MPKQGKQQRLIEGFYSGLGPIYNFIYGKLLFNEGRRVAIQFLDIQAGQKILEVGVGTGLTLPIYPTDCHVVGIDLSESMLKEARELIAEQGIKNTEVRYMDATKIDYPDNHFDGVLGNLFISATSRPVEALFEMKRVCKPGGMIVLMNHFRSENTVVGAMEKVMDPFTTAAVGFRSALEMEPLLTAAGLKAKQVKKVNLFGLWTAVSMENKK